MTWTTPRTWATGDEITATRLNEQLRDNMLELRSSRTARVRRLTAQSIPDSADPCATAIGFTSEDFDVPAWHSNTTNNTRITPDVAGVYLVTANVEFAANAPVTGQSGSASTESIPRTCGRRPQHPHRP